jgi:DNA-binding MarR family transcriptional regulator
MTIIAIRDSRRTISCHDMTLTQSDFEHLLELRTGLRRFQRWSTEQAEAVGITSGQHQLMLAIRGHAGPNPPTIGEIADYLVLRHHSAVGLIDRAVAAGLVKRNPDARHTVRVTLTRLGAQKLEKLTEAHLAELAEVAPQMRALWGRLARRA